MLEQVKWIAEKIEYGAKILSWAAHALGSFPVPDKKEPKEPGNTNTSAKVAVDAE